MEKVPKHKKVKLVTNEKRKHYLIFELNYHLTKWLKINDRDEKISCNAQASLWST